MDAAEWTGPSAQWAPVLAVGDGVRVRLARGYAWHIHMSGEHRVYWHPVDLGSEDGTLTWIGAGDLLVWPGYLGPDRDEWEPP